MDKLTPIKYLNAIKRQIEITNIVGNNIFFNFIGDPFNFYNGKKISFKSNDITYNGVYGVVNNLNCIKLDSIGNLNVSDVINIFETFSITENNELPTLTDIVKNLSATKSNLTLTELGINLAESGNYGILTDIDKLKLNDINFLIDNPTPFVFSDVPAEGSDYVEILKLPLTTTQTKFGLYLKSNLGYLYNGNLEILKPNLINLSTTLCSFPVDKKIQLKFDLEEYEDGKVWVKLSIKTFEAQSISVSISSNSLFQYSTGLPITTSPIQLNSLAETPTIDLNINKNLISASNKHISYILETFETADKTVNTYKSMVEIGGINIGDDILVGTTIEDLVKKLVLKKFVPTFDMPTLTLDILNPETVFEAGTNVNIELNAIFNRGSINGKMENGIWLPNSIQNSRAGEVTNYLFNDSIDNDLVNELELPNIQIIDGDNVFKVLVEYGQGAQPVDSDGENYGLPLNAGSIEKSEIIKGYRNLFYGVDLASTDLYDTSVEVRTLTNKKLNPINGTTFSIQIPVGTKMVVFAYPATLRDVSSVKYIEGMMAEIKGIFQQSVINVEGNNSYFAIPYKVYTYIPVLPFETVVNYQVTI